MRRVQCYKYCRRVSREWASDLPRARFPELPQGLTVLRCKVRQVETSQSKARLSRRRGLTHSSRELQEMRTLRCKVHRWNRQGNKETKPRQFSYASQHLERIRGTRLMTRRRQRSVPFWSRSPRVQNGDRTVKGPRPFSSGSLVRNRVRRCTRISLGRTAATKNPYAYRVRRGKKTNTKRHEKVSLAEAQGRIICTQK